MKDVNLISLVQAYQSFDKTLLENYFEYFEIKPKDVELNDLETYVDILRQKYFGSDIFDNFFFGYSIPQIGKEFDLLRFGYNYTLNIELKSINTGDKITKQLKRNQYYLGFLEGDIYNYTFVTSEKKLYSLDDKGNLIEVDFETLINVLENQNVKEVSNLDSIFNPSNYLVSPFNSTIKFIKDEYFLTVQQENFKKNIISSISSIGATFISICGKAGTGKTLLTYDIAKDFINNNQKVLVVHCGKLNQGHCALRDDFGWEIIPIKYISHKKLSEYSLIVIDEVQRVYPTQLELIINDVKKYNSNCIFSYDASQCLSSWEISNDIEKYISKTTSSKAYELTKKIRTNKEIASFILGILNRDKIINKQNRPNVKLTYFKNYSEAKKYLSATMEDGWKVINYTPSRGNLPYLNFHIEAEDNAHEVIGQEYDNVVAVIDNHFYYKNNLLSTRGYTSKPYYHPTKMLFQIMTRTRRKLSIVIIDNKEIMERCLSILHAN